VTLEFAPIFERWPMLLDGALVTLKLAAVAILGRSPLEEAERRSQPP
jgi:hypothetical protein